MNPVSALFTMKATAAKTGLTPHTIRAWERRYGALTPSRTHSNRRLYTQQEVERLSLLARAVQNGSSISQIANLPIQDLRSLSSSAGPSRFSHAPTDSGSFVSACLRAIEDFNSESLEICLVHATAILGTMSFIESVILPLLEIIGRRWDEGTLTVGQEHLASAAVRTQLDRIRIAIRVAESAPAILLTTPSGQLHEFGALICAISAAVEGWRPIYLGPNLPSSEIARAASSGKAVAIALSMVYPSTNSSTESELRNLRDLVGRDLPILVGGRVAPSYSSTIREIKGILLTDLRSFRKELEELASRSFVV